MEKQQFLEFIEKQRHLGETRMVGLSFGNANLAGVELSEFALPGIDLSGADLSGAILTRVDFTRANLVGARFDGAVLHMVDAPGAQLAKMQASGAHFEHVSFNQADMSQANLNKVMFDACSLVGAVFDESLLQNGQLVYSNCRDASFREANLDHLATVGSIFTGANFLKAKNFSRSPEIVTEILRREAEEDFELVMTTGAINLDRTNGLARWREYVKNHSKIYEFARRVFANYPDSGCLEVLPRND